MLEELNRCRVAEIGVVLSTHVNGLEVVLAEVGIAVDPSLELLPGHAHTVR